MREYVSRKYDSDRGKHTDTHIHTFFKKKKITFSSVPWSRCELLNIVLDVVLTLHDLVLGVDLYIHHNKNKLLKILLMT